MLLERDKDAIEMLDSSRTFTEKNLRELIGVGGNIFLFVIIGSCFKYFVDYNVLIMQFASPVKEKKTSVELLLSVRSLSQVTRII